MTHLSDPLSQSSIIATSGASKIHALRTESTLPGLSIPGGNATGCASQRAPAASASAEWELQGHCDGQDLSPVHVPVTWAPALTVTRQSTVARFSGRNTSLATRNSGFGSFPGSPGVCDPSPAINLCVNWRVQHEDV